MQMANDPTLTALANRLNGVRSWPLEGDASYRIRVLSGRPFHNSYFSAAYRKSLVKLGLGGRQLILGITSNPYVSARYADMCIVHFWKYRRNVGPNRQPLDCDLNFSVLRARADLAECAEVSNIIHAIEAHLLASGSIAPPESVAPAHFTKAQHCKSLLRIAEQYSLALHAACAIITETEPESRLLVDLALKNNADADTLLRDISKLLNK